MIDAKQGKPRIWGSGIQLLQNTEHNAGYGVLRRDGKAFGG
jgi:hypothetical protein